MPILIPSTYLRPLKTPSPDYQKQNCFNCFNITQIGKTFELTSPGFEFNVVPNFNKIISLTPNPQLICTHKLLEQRIKQKAHKHTKCRPHQEGLREVGSMGVIFSYNK